MATKTVTLEHFNPLYAWRNRLLRVDLSDGRIWAQETGPYLPDFLGARGLAARILWDEYPEPVGAFDPRNPLMIMPGALTGTRSPYSGRTAICTFGPQGSPYTWFTHANIGAGWGHELKRAGYDGVIVTGASETPVRLLIRDDEVSLVPAGELWGMDALRVQQVIAASDGARVKTLTIGVAGEKLSRIATIHTANTSVAGQGGFGAVMGSKKLKAITVVGSRDVEVAHPERLQTLFKGVIDAAQGIRGGRRRGGSAWTERIKERLAQEGGGGDVRIVPCTQYCVTPCRMEVRDIEGCHFHEKFTSVIGCVSGLFGGGHTPPFDWELGGMRERAELNMHANRLGLNHWDILIGMVPWLRAAQAQGLISDINGVPMDWNSVDFWVALLDAIAYREGIGDALAEGGWRAAHQLDMGVELMRRYYTGWGYAGHWDGHACFTNRIVYPFWITGALHWAMDTRDPASSTHGYVQSVMMLGPWGWHAQGDNAITWDDMRAIGERVYGRADTLDPLSGYAGKATAAAFHSVRSIIKDCLSTDDQIFPMIYTPATDDHFVRVGDIDGPDVEAHLFAAGTGVDWDPAAFSRAAERVLNLERAITVRHFGRDRTMDERVLPSFEYNEIWVNPEIGTRQALDREAFEPVMDEYLQLRGWDTTTGWPTRETLTELGLPDVYDPMIAGALKAKATLPELPPVPPVIDHHKDDPPRE